MIAQWFDYLFSCLRTRNQRPIFQIASMLLFLRVQVIPVHLFQVRMLPVKV